MDFVVFVVIRVIEIYMMAIAVRRLLTWFEVRPDHVAARVLDTFVERSRGRYGSWCRPSRGGTSRRSLR